LAGVLRALRLWGRLALRVNEWTLIAFSGCMRGVIAYALILHALPDQDRQSAAQTIMVSTVLGIVLLNCLVFGGLFPCVLSALKIGPQRDRLNQTSDVESPTTLSPNFPPRNVSLQPQCGGGSPCLGSPSLPGLCRTSSLRDTITSIQEAPTSIREGIGEGFVKVDDRWLKKWFRPEKCTKEKEAHEHARGQGHGPGHGHGPQMIDKSTGGTADHVADSASAASSKKASHLASTASTASTAAPSYAEDRSSVSSSIRE
jgi:hypothetical protein